MSTGLSTRQEQGFQALKKVFSGEDLKQAMRDALPSHLTPERMIRVALTSFRKNPALLECQPASVVKAVMEASQLGLEIDGILGHAYLVPYKSECQLIPGYKGLIQLVRNSGEIAIIKAGLVRSGDEFEWTEVPPVFRHKSQTAGDTPITHVYAWVRFKSGDEDFVVWTTDMINAHRKRYSPSKSQSSPWETCWEWMAKKTVLRQLCKLMPLSIEVQRLVARDEYYEAGVLHQTGHGQQQKRAYVSTLNNVVAIEQEPLPETEREPGDESESDGQLFETQATTYDAGH